MKTGSVATFEQSLAKVDATSTTVDPEGFTDALEAAIETPAVGAPLPFEDVSLADTSVTVDPSRSALQAAACGVTGSPLGIAELGTVAIESTAGGDELVSLYPERHVAVVRASDVEPDLTAAFGWLSDQFDAGRQSFVMATGPSATGDMGALVQGVHGPSTEHVIIIEDNE
ncbi:MULTISPECIES: LUD domain-containing protein [Haloarcula]|uniref:LUD domain-containing protein n=1 Tax=Haloarcula TaxID=2237 RepID=UPI0023EB3E14|nr:LUD domain-containing protein [Halomicroarcula sp. XH51]